MHKILIQTCLTLIAYSTTFSGWSQAVDAGTITKEEWEPGKARPIPVALSGFSGEVSQVIQFDLHVQGFKFVSADKAQFLINGSNSSGVTGRVVDRLSKATLLSRSYTTAPLRDQAHRFSDDIVQAITRSPGIGRSKIAYKVQKGGTSEIYVADFDGHRSTSVTSDQSIVAAPIWVPGKLAIYYTSYKLGPPDIFYHNLSDGNRRVFSRRPGLNSGAAVSPDGSQVAMILSKDGNPEVYVSNADGGNLRRLTSTPGADESSPCWSPDGRWVCFATKIRGRRELAKVSVQGGTLQRIRTAGVVNPSEPDWSPDGKWIAFTAQMGNFELCVIPSEGGDTSLLVGGEDPSWSPNSRTLVFTRRTSNGRGLSLLDVPTKQVKHVARVSGNNSQPSWSR